MARLHVRQVNVGFHYGSTADAKRSERTIGEVYQAGLGLPDRDYYAKTDSASQAIRAQYLEHVTHILRLAGADSSAASPAARSILALETALANASMTKEASETPRPCTISCTEWGMSPPTVNASYNPLYNALTFPAGIMQPPFFDPKADDAVNYGGMGAVIGHELTHGFDDQGRQFDAKGNLSGWWDSTDARQFTERAEALVKQAGDYVAVDTLRVNGKLTLGENIADLGGLADRLRCVPAQPRGQARAAADRRAHGGSAILSRLGADLAQQVSTRVLPAPGQRGSARAVGVSSQSAR